MSNYTVMTLNLWCDFMHIIGTKGFAHRIRSIETIIDQYRPDIIGMQEMTSAMVPYMEEKILKEYGMFGAHRRSLMNNEANPILYRKGRRIPLSSFPISPHCDHRHTQRQRERRTAHLCQYAFGCQLFLHPEKAGRNVMPYS